MEVLVGEQAVIMVILPKQVARVLLVRAMLVEPKAVRTTPVAVEEQELSVGLETALPLVERVLLTQSWEHSIIGAAEAAVLDILYVVVMVVLAEEAVELSVQILGVDQP